MTSESLKSFLAPEMAKVDRVLRESLSSEVVLIRQISEYIVGGGGKRLRPALVLLAARACGYEGDKHYTLAAVIEMIHTATLLHDDVVDESKLRRGHATANATFGNAASVLVGDFLYSRAFQLMVGVGSVRVLEILSQATNVIAEGEVMQLMNSGNPNLDESAYLTVIQRKTAKLFEAAAQLGAVLGGAPPEREAALARYGMHLGTSFQLVDDVLDYQGEQSAIGKNPGDDLAEGKMTLPLIRAIAVGSAEDASVVQAAITGGRLTEFGHVMDVLARTGSLEYTLQCAIRESEKAAACVGDLPASPYRENLLELASFAARRNY
ncbi:MAG TPA: polyprenyl synthetase family protein [Casimicrobiaceae bacterium]|nr:polyprenyl synthetase family protein [Casimicrobiaceae bacterium]